MGWVTWATAAIRMLVPRTAVESAHVESEVDDEESFVGITIQLEDPPEEDDECDADSSFFGRARLHGDSPQEHDVYEDNGYEDDVYLCEEGLECGCKTLSEETARELANDDRDLSFSSLSELSADAAKALAQHKGRLYLDGLTTLSPQVAKALAQHKGHLVLRELTTLSDKAAKALAQTTGYLYLTGPTRLSEEAANALRANPKVQLPEGVR